MTRNEAITRRATIRKELDKIRADRKANVEALIAKRISAADATVFDENAKTRAKELEAEFKAIAPPCF